MQPEYLRATFLHRFIESSTTSWEPCKLGKDANEDKYHTEKYLPLIDTAAAEVTELKGFKPSPAMDRDENQSDQELREHILC